LGKMTLPCEVEKVNNFSFRIVLIQGINRQIRRMSYKLGYEVLLLIRVRIGEIALGDLQANRFRYLSL
jgi:23S rRNA pseudouridine2604 synthase